MTKCLKCQEEYIPKRRGGLFCKTSCGNAYRQQAQRNKLKQASLIEQGQAVENPLTDTELYLWGIISKLNKTAEKLDTAYRLPEGDYRKTGLGSRIYTFIGDCARLSFGLRIKEIEARAKEQQEVEERNSSKQ